VEINSPKILYQF